MSWLILTFINAVSGSLTRILQKILLQNEKNDPIAFAFIFQLTVATIFLLYTLLTNSFEFPDLKGLGLNLLIMVLFYSLGNITTFKAFKLAQAAEVSILFTSSVAWSVISALIFLDESLTWVKVGGIILIITGVSVVNYTKSKWKLNRGHAYALISAMFFGLAFANDAFIIERYQSLASYMALSFTLPAIAALLFKPSAVKNLAHFKSYSVMGKLIICALLYAVAAISIFGAYKAGGPASLIAPISKTGVILTVILSYLFLKEEDHLPKKIIGASLVFIGAVLLVM